MTWSRQAILAAATKWNTQHGRPPTSKQWANANPHHPAQSTVWKMFGSWNEMLAEAGFRPRPNNWQKALKFSREQIIHEILEFKFSHGRLPTYREFSAPDPNRRRPSSRTIERVFGSWNGALVAAGYDPPFARRSAKSYRASISAVTKAAA